MYAHIYVHILYMYTYTHKYIYIHLYIWTYKSSSFPFLTDTLRSPILSSPHILFCLLAFLIQAFKQFILDLLRDWDFVNMCTAHNGKGPLSLSLSLSLTHTHTYTHTRMHTMMRALSPSRPLSCTSPPYSWYLSLPLALARSTARMHAACACIPRARVAYMSAKNPYISAKESLF